MPVWLIPILQAMAGGATGAAVGSALTPSQHSSGPAQGGGFGQLPDPLKPERLNMQDPTEHLRKLGFL